MNGQLEHINGKVYKSPLPMTPNEIVNEFDRLCAMDKLLTITDANNWNTLRAVIINSLIETYYKENVK